MTHLETGHATVQEYPDATWNARRHWNSGVASSLRMLKPGAFSSESLSRI
jgi:hypothetical protein